MPVPVVTTPTTPRVIAKGVAIPTLSISATNTPTGYAATPLPTGISVNTSSGAITGTPTAAGLVTTSITATNGSGTSDAVSMVWDVQDSPTGLGTWSDVELDFDLLTHELSRPLASNAEDAALVTLLRKDEISLLIGFKKHGVLQDLKPGSETVSVKLVLKEFEPEINLTLAGGTPTKVGSGTTTRFRIALELSEADWTVLAGYEGNFKTELFVYGEIEVEVGTYRKTSVPCRVRVVRDHFEAYVAPSPSPSASPSPSVYYYAHTLSESASTGEVACSLYPGSTSLFYSTSSSLTNGVELFIDSGVTHAGEGFFSDGTSFWRTNSLGVIIDTGSCYGSPSPSPSPTPTPTPSPSASVPPSYYTHSLTYDFSSYPTACAFGSPTDYYSADVTLAGGSRLWTDTALSIEASSGFYSDGTNYFDYVNSVGAASIETCSPPP